MFANRRARSFTYLTILAVVGHTIQLPRTHAGSLTITLGAGSQTSVPEGTIGELFFTITNNTGTPTTIDKVGFPLTVPTGIEFASGDKTDAVTDAFLIDSAHCVGRDLHKGETCNFEVDYTTSSPPVPDNSDLGTWFIEVRVDSHETANANNTGFDVEAVTVNVVDTPEPSTITLLAIGSVPLFGFMWKRRGSLARGLGERVEPFACADGSGRFFVHEKLQGGFRRV